MAQRKVGILTGSLRKGSYSRQIAACVQAMFPKDIDAQMIDIGQLALYNQDFDDENNTPEAWKAFREQIRALDGYLFVTPEYNRSVPPVLKNALDIGSRPYGQSAWEAKPGAIISVAPGKIGGFGANHHLRQVMTFLNIFMMQQPEAYVGNVTDLLDASGKLTNDGTRKFLQSFVDAFVSWMDRFSD